MSELRQFWGDATTLGDLEWAGHLFENIGKRVPAILTAGDKASQEDRQFVTMHWSSAIVVYGRCFSHAFGRRTLDLSHVERWGGDLAIHKQLMHEHDNVVVNFSYDDREVQRYVQLAPEAEGRKVTNLAFVEQHRPVPTKEHCDAVAKHVNRLHDFMGAELRLWMEELCKEIDAKYRDQLYECAANGVPWAPPAAKVAVPQQPATKAAPPPGAPQPAQNAGGKGQPPRQSLFSPLFTANFKFQLKRQLGFLQRSCAAYDQGHHDDAIRIGTIIRVLLHDTASSTSLLTHMRSKSILLLSTVDSDAVGPGVFYFLGLGMGKTAPDGKSFYTPKYGDGPFSRFVTFDQWWNQVVFVNSSVSITRRHIVLGAANKDGGAHVDMKLSEEYAALMALAMTKLPPPLQGLVPPVSPVNVELVSLRQMGHELLNSPQLLNLAL
jgi:hypothetical protein